MGRPSTRTAVAVVAAGAAAMTTDDEEVPEEGFVSFVAHSPCASTATDAPSPDRATSPSTVTATCG
jgi:hypothetical protein